MHSPLAALMTLFLLAPLMACTTVEKTADDTWETTKELYRDYINVDPTVDVEQVDSYDDGQDELARLMTPVDMRLEHLRRVLTTRDRFPDDEWIEFIFKRFSWLSGIVVTDTEGEDLLTRTLYPLKPVDASSLLDVGDAWTDRRLRGRFEATPLGPELYVGNAFFKDNQWMGVIALHFDMERLMRQAGAPQQLVIFTPEGILWEGGLGRAASDLIQEDWVDILSDDVSGYMDAGDQEYYWLVRYLGDLRIVYAVPVE